jgi:hypothetical protein
LFGIQWGGISMRRSFLVTIAALVVATLGAAPARAGVIFTDDFNAGASPLWGNEIGSWTTAGGVYFATSPSNFPNAHSSLPFSLTNFSIDFDVNQLQDGGVWLRSTEAPGTAVGRTGILLVTGGDLGTGTGLYWHIVTDPSTYGAQFAPVNGLFTPGVSDAHIHVVVSGNTYSAFVDGSSVPATTLTTPDFADGQIALYDFSHQTFDNVVVATPTAVPEPSSMILFATGVVGVVYCRRRRGPCSWRRSA